MTKTKKLTKQMLLDWGIKSVVQNDKGEWIITREWFINKSSKKQTYNIKVNYSRCKHKYSKDKYYPVIGFSTKEGVKTFTLSKFLYAWFNNEVPENYDVDHIDNNPFNNNLDNLQLLTREENLKKRFSDNNHCSYNQYGYSEKYDNIKVLKKLAAAYKSKGYNDLWHRTNHLIKHYDENEETIKKVVEVCR